MTVTWTPIRRRGGRLALAILVATLGIGLPAASSARAEIVVGQSVGQFRLGYSKAKVRRIYGKPTSANAYPRRHEVVWSYVKLLTVISFKHGRLSGFFTLSKQQRTNKGIGPGSSYAATRAAYPKARCEEGTFGPQARTCTLYTTFRGHKVRTDFVFYKKSLPMREVDVAVQRPKSNHRR